jgi:hypothetical protein
LGEFLADCPEEPTATAQLLLSELVTNVVMHAGTDMSIDARFVSPNVVRCEVQDDHPTLPTMKRHSVDAPTGRGLRLLASGAQRWGVEPLEDGKRVWFEVAMTSDSQPEETTGGHVSLPRAPDGSAAHQERAEETRLVQILDLPIAAYREAEEHNDGVMRELQLLAQGAAAGQEGTVPGRLLELAEQVSSVFSAATDRLRQQVELAEQAGHVTVDMEMHVPVSGWEVLVTLARKLDELDRFSDSGDLMMLASPPSVRRFRTWYTAQVADQMRGRPPTPWPFGTAVQTRTAPT